MTQGVVDLFELIEVDHDDRKCAPGARCPLPFRLQGFHEKAARLDAGQAVGDRLLLQLLEDEGVVQRGGQQIGQGAQDQHFGWTKRLRGAAFHVQHTQRALAIDDGQAEDRTGVEQQRAQRLTGARAAVAMRRLEQRHIGSASYAADDAGVARERNAPTQQVGGAAGLHLDFNLLGAVIENPNANVIEVEVLANLFPNGAQHPLGALARYGSVGNVVEECQVVRPALFARIQPRQHIAEGAKARQRHHSNDGGRERQICGGQIHSTRGTLL